MLSLYLACALAAADAPPAEARRLFRGAEGAAQAGQWAQAAGLFIEAFRAQPHAHAAYNAAQALLRSGDPAAALAWLDEAARAPGVQTLPNLESQRSDLAASLAASGSGGWVRVHTAPVGGQVEIDAQPRGETPLAAGLAPGAHRVKVTLLGSTLEQTLAVETGSTHELWLSARRRGARSFVALGFTAGAAAALGVGLGFGVSAQSSSRALLGGLHEQPEAQRLFDGARQSALVANVLFCICAALALGGGWLFWTDR